MNKNFIFTRNITNMSAEGGDISIMFIVKYDHFYI